MSEEQTSQATTEDVMYPSLENPATETPKEGADEKQDQKDTETAAPEKGQEEEQEESKDESKEESSSGENEDKDIKYELELSEGSLLAKEKVDEIAEFAKKHGLSNEAAQEVLKAQESVVSEHMEGLREQHKKAVEGWYQESVNDPEIGGDNLKQHAERAKRAIDAFGTEALANGLKETGYANHPEVVRVFSKIGELIDNDEIVMPGKNLKQRSRAEILYGNND